MSKKDKAIQDLRKMLVMIMFIKAMDIWEIEARKYINF